MIKYVVIDPGHGGTDPGAIGVSKTKESLITLAIVKKIKPILERCGLAVILTRSTDEFVGINERVKIEKKTSNYCFVSIHCNAFDGSVSGLEVLYSGSNNGQKLANCIYNQLITDNLYNKKRGIKVRKDLGVLINTICPSALVETAFIDNANDFVLLEKLDLFAKSISKGICSYIGATFVEEIKPITPNKGESKLLKVLKNKVVKYGSKGNHVKVLQSSLVELGYDPKGVDGSCGNGCVAAIKQYQKNNGLAVDGSCGPATWTNILTK